MDQVRTLPADEQIRGDGKEFSVRFWRKGNLEGKNHQVVAATVDGEVETSGTDWFVFGPKPAADIREDDKEIRGMAANEAKEFRIFQRKQAWVTFDGFAREPKMAPREVSTEEAVAAEELAKRRAEEKRLVTLAAKRAEWRAVPADATTEMGAVRMLVDAIQKGDENGVQAMLISEQLEAEAHGLVVIEQLRALAVERFGELAVEDHLRAWGVLDLEQYFMGEEWERTADGMLTLNDWLSIRKRTDGTYVVSVNQVPEAEQIRAMTAWRKGQKRLLEENREMTLEAFKAAIRPREGEEGTR